MPQMAPISWLTLFLMFSASLILFNTMNYYLFMPNMPKTKNQSKKNLMKSMNWKW